MRSAALVLSCSLALFLLAGSLQAAIVEPAVIEADVVEINLDRETVLARGQAQLQYRSMTLTGNELQADWVTGEVRSIGDIQVHQDDRRMTGEQVEYNLQTGKGLLHGARVMEQGVVVTGDEISVTPQEVIARHARATTCDHPDPHYAFAADSITLTAAQQPGDNPQSGRLSLHRGRLLYHDHTLMRLPDYSFAVGDIEQRRGLPIASGFSRDDGPYTSTSVSFGGDSGRISGRLGGRYTSFRGLRGEAVLAAPAGPTELNLLYAIRQDPADQLLDPDDLEAPTTDVIVNRKPEFSLALPERALTRSLRFSVSGAIGSYSEQTKDAETDLAEAGRTSLKTLLQVPPYQVMPRLELSHAVGWRQSHYSTGKDYTVRLFRNTAAFRFSPKLRLALSYVIRDDSGTTPFRFDGVESPRQFVTELTWTVNPAWRLHLIDDYRPDAVLTRDLAFEATRTAHCLEYTVGWRRERGQFYLGIGLAPPSAGLPE